MFEKIIAIRERRVLQSGRQSNLRAASVSQARQRNFHLQGKVKEVELEKAGYGVSGILRSCFPLVLVILRPDLLGACCCLLSQKESGSKFKDLEKEEKLN